MSPADRITAAETKAAPVALQKAREAVSTSKFADPVWKAAQRAKDVAGMEQREDELVAREMRPPTAGAPPVRGGVPAGGSSGAQLPANASASNLTVGTVYQTARGPARWTGTGFAPI
jgi:hypothetical protein